jgi:DNA-binding LacI/PurR family transcriptional regulator
LAIERTKRPTKADVARLAKVSPATVSYVLNNVSNQRISEQTRAAVHQAAAEIGYRPNLSARNLATGASGVVLYIVPRMSLGELAIEVGSRLTTALARRGLVLSLQFETEDGANIVDAIENLNPMAVAGVFPLEGAALDAVTAAGINQIYLGAVQLGALGELNLTVGEMWAERLTANCHQRLAFARSPIKKLHMIGDYWLAGLRAAAQRRGLPPIPVETLAADGHDAADIITDWTRNGVTAVCSQNDETAFSVLHGVRGAGLHCPQDLAVIGVDAIPLGAVSTPPLTTIGFDAETIVELSVSAMMAELGFAPAPAPAPDISIAYLVERASA